MKFLSAVMKCCSWVQLFSLLGLFAALIVWPFGGWTIAWRIGLTALIFFVLASIIYNGVRNYLQKTTN